MSRSESLVARFLRVLRALGGRSKPRQGDRPSSVGRNSGRGSRRSPADDSEAAILDWLEDGEEIEDEEKYWQKRIHHEEPVLDGETDEIASVTQEPRQGSPSYKAEMTEGVLGGEPTQIEDRPNSGTKTRLRRVLSIVSDLADVVHGFFKSLRGIDLLLLGAVVILLVVVVMMVFPATLTWGKTIVNVRKWPFWVWTCILVATFGYLAWLRSRHE